MNEYDFLNFNFFNLYAFQLTFLLQGFDPFIDTLPQELFLRVLSYLGPNDLAFAARVSSTWSAFCGELDRECYAFLRN